MFSNSNIKTRVKFVHVNLTILFAYFLLLINIYWNILLYIHIHEMSWKYVSLIILTFKSWMYFTWNCRKKVPFRRLLSFTSPCTPVHPWWLTSLQNTLYIPYTFTDAHTQPTLSPAHTHMQIWFISSPGRLPPSSLAVESIKHEYIFFVLTHPKTM